MFTETFLVMVATVIGITQAIKAKLPITGVAAWIISGIIGIIASIAYGLTKGLDPVSIGFLAIAVVLASNGWYVFLPKTAK